MTTTPTRSDAARRTVRTATVVRTEDLSPEMIRVHLTLDDPAAFPELAGTDAYVKLLFAPEGASYAWPFDPDEIRETKPREEWPVTRTYTIRSVDRESGNLDIDFVVHGDSGLAGPWAGAAKPGDTLGFLGPGGAWSPEPDADHHLFVGDESAAPAIAAALDALPETAAATVYLEVSSAGAHIPLREMPGVDVRWIHRNESGSGYGVALSEAVRAQPLPKGRVIAFVHGNADMIKELRRFLLVENGLPRGDVSISGYWRTGHTEDRWQATKREFVTQMEAEQDGSAS